MKKKIIIISLFVLFIIVVVILASKKGDKGALVTTAKVSTGDITQIVTGSGKIYPVTEVKISAKVAGEIIHLKVEEGDRVKKGQVLVKLDREQYLANLDRAKSMVLSAGAGYRLAKTEFDRTADLQKKNLVSQAEYEKATAGLEEAEATLKQAEASLKEAEDALDKTVVRSPIDGIVIQKNKEQGEIALGSQFQADVIMVVADLSSMEARIEVNENDIPKLTTGDSCVLTIDAFPDSVFTGKVSRIAHSPIIQGMGTSDEVTNYLVNILLDSPLNAFRSGMSCTADALTETHRNVLRVPIQAVTVREPQKLNINGDKEDLPEKEGNDENYSRPDYEEVVFVFEDGKAVKKPVKLGLADDNYYEITDGLTEGEEVITGPFRLLSQKLEDGQQVRKKRSGRKDRSDGK